MSVHLNLSKSAKIGAGPTPIETKDGWLLLYHGVRISCSGYVYAGGMALLDLDELIAFTKKYGKI
jgi:beta-1,4-mannooligosaccharide/beta-1,4-mannosyl-N-acetylglucosamine phosphorylase